MRLLFLCAVFFLSACDDPGCHERPSNPNSALDAPFCDER